MPTINEAALPTSAFAQRGVSMPAILTDQRARHLNRFCRFARLIGYDGGMRFRPRFSLKILLLLVAAIAAFCAYQVNWIQQRHVFLAQHALDAQHFDEAYSQYVPDPTKPRV